MSKTTFKFNSTGGMTTGVTAVSAELSNWFIKKPPTAMAKSKRRWLELYPEEIKYFSKEEDGAGTVDSCKGTIGLFKDTAVECVGESIKITNPDRVWELKIDLKAVGSSDSTGSARKRMGSELAWKWAEEIKQRAGESKNAGYLGDAADDGGAGDAEAAMSSLSVDPSATSFGSKFKRASARSFYGFEYASQPGETAGDSDVEEEAAGFGSMPEE